MKFKTTYCEANDAYFKTGRYNNGNLALEVWSRAEGPLCVCTVNPGFPLPPTHIAVKNYSENEGMEQALRDLDIIGEQTGIIPSGFVKIPVFLLTEYGRALFDAESEEP